MEELPSLDLKRVRQLRFPPGVTKVVAVLVVLAIGGFITLY